MPVMSFAWTTHRMETTKKVSRPTGVAAILRFPMDLSHIDQQLDSSSSDSTSGDETSSFTSESSEDGEEAEMFNVLKGSFEGGPNNNNNV